MTTPSQLDTANPAILKALADAVVNLRTHHVPLDASYGQVQHASRNGKTIPDPRMRHRLLQRHLRRRRPGRPARCSRLRRGLRRLFAGDDHRAHPERARSEGILTYSQSTDPTSPWYANMTKLYSEKKWVPLAYTAAELRAEHGTSTETVSVP